jgi:hypothetical protein
MCQFLFLNSEYHGDNVDRNIGGYVAVGGGQCSCEDLCQNEILNLL